MRLGSNYQAQVPGYLPGDCLLHVHLIVLKFNNRMHKSLNLWHDTHVQVSSSESLVVLCCFDHLSSKP